MLGGWRTQRAFREKSIGFSPGKFIVHKVADAVFIGNGIPVMAAQSIGDPRGEIRIEDVRELLPSDQFTAFDHLIELFERNAGDIRQVGPVQNVGIKPVAVGIETPAAEACLGAVEIFLRVIVAVFQADVVEHEIELQDIGVLVAALGLL